VNSTKVSCNADQIAYVKSATTACLNANEIQDCQVNSLATTAEYLKSGTYQADLCQKPVTNQGINYTDPYDFLRKYYNRDVTDGSCVLVGERKVPDTKTTESAKVVKSFAPDSDIPKNFLTAAQAKFQDRFVFSAIIRDQVADVGAGCPLDTFFSYGSRYKAIADQIGSRGHISSICLQDYSDALNPISQFVKTITANTYSFPEQIPEGSIVKSVIVKRGEVELHPEIGVDITIVGSEIKFLSENYLQEGDEFIILVDVLE
jgi:hypothetical protein